VANLQQEQRGRVVIFLQNVWTESEQSSILVSDGFSGNDPNRTSGVLLAGLVWTGLAWAIKSVDCLIA